MFSLLNHIDTALAFLPSAARAALYGIVTGIIAMLLYWLLSPQRRITALKREIAETRTSLRAYTGEDVREILRLSRAAIAPAVKQLLFMLGPTLVAALPVIGIMAWLGQAYGSREVWAVGPGWMRTWHAPFMTALTVAVLGMKMGFKIA